MKAAMCSRVIAATAVGMPGLGEVLGQQSERLEVGLDRPRALVLGAKVARPGG